MPGLWFPATISACFRKPAMIRAAESGRDLVADQKLILEQ